MIDALKSIKNPLIIEILKHDLHHHKVNNL